MKNHFAYIRGPFSTKRTIKSKDEWDVMLQNCALVTCTVVEGFYCFQCYESFTVKICGYTLKNQCVFICNCFQNIS